MPAKTQNPFLSLALSSLMIGALHHYSWSLIYTGLLFGFGFAIGVKRPRPVWAWLLILAAGAPVVGLGLQIIPGFRPAGTFLLDVAGSMLAAMAALGSGLVSGLCFRHLRRLRAQPSTTA